MNNRKTLLLPLTNGIAFFLGVELGGFQIVLLKAAEEFSLDPIVMGTVVTAQFIAIFFGPLLFGWVSDRIGKKTVLLASMICFIAGCLGAALSETVMLFSFAAFILGLGYSVSECVGTSFLSDSFPGKESAYINIMQGFFSFGAVLSPLLFSRLMSAGLVSWRAVFLTAAGGYALIYPLLILYRDTRLRTESSDTQKTKPPSGIKTGIFSPFFIILIFSIMSYNAVEAGIGFFADTLFVTEYKNTELGAYAISGFWFTMAVSRLVFSRIKMKPQNMVLTGLLLISVLLFLSLILRNAYVLLAIFFLLGIVSAPVWPMIIGIGASLDQKRSGTNTSILYASGGMGGIFMPVLIGAVAKHHGFYNSFWVLVVFSVAGFVLMWFWTRKRTTQGL